MIDLHSHSTVSDGTDSPTELLRNAAAAGLTVLALSDHDTFDGLAEARAEAERVGVELVDGMEMSCGLEGRSVHLLAYGADPHDEALLAELVRLRGGRDERLPQMVRRLNELGMEITVEDVLAQVGDAPSVGRPHVADALVARGHVADRTEAFDRFLADGGPAYVERYQTPLVRGIELVHGAGGVAVVAHPWGRGSREVLGAEVLTALVREHGLDGFEVDHRDHDRLDTDGRSMRETLRELADGLGVLGTGSSDYHGLGKKDLPLGAYTTDPETYARLRELMRRA